MSRRLGDKKKFFDKARIYNILATTFYITITYFIKGNIWILTSFLIIYFTYFLLIRFKVINFNDGEAIRSIWHLIYTGYIIYNMSLLFINVTSIQPELIFLIESLLIIVVVYLPLWITKGIDKGLLSIQRLIFYIIVVSMVLVIIITDEPKIDKYLDYFWLMPLIEMLGILFFRNIKVKINQISN